MKNLAIQKKMVVGGKYQHRNSCHTYWDSLPPPHNSINVITNQKIMAQSKKKAVGIGAVGTCMAKFIHLRAPIKEAIYKNYTKHCYEDHFIVSKGMHWINKKDQIAYECCIPSISDDNIVFKIMCSHFTVTQSPNEPFADKHTSNPLTACTTNNNEVCASTMNIPCNLPKADDCVDDITRL